MSRKLVAFFALAMVCALVAADDVDDAKLDMVPLVLPVPGEAGLNRAVRSPADGKKTFSCSDKSCFKGCHMVNGKPECMP